MSDHRQPRDAYIALRILAVLLGVFFLATSVNKLPWLTQPSLLTARFERWLPDASPYAMYYLRSVAIPASDIFARLVPAAEFLTGLALISGVSIRVASLLSLFMVVNFHVATSAFSSWAFLRDGTGLPVLGALMALSIGGNNLPFSITLNRKRRLMQSPDGQR